MTTYILYSGPAGTGRLTVTARPTAAGTPQAQWLVTFTRRGKHGKQLDQCAAWIPPNRPELQGWVRSRWHPIGSRLIPPAVLATVEAWLRGGPVPSIEPITTETP